MFDRSTSKLGVEHFDFAFRLIDQRENLAFMHTNAINSQKEEYCVTDMHILHKTPHIFQRQSIPSKGNIYTIHYPWTRLSFASPHCWWNRCGKPKVSAHFSGLVGNRRPHLWAERSRYLTYILRSVDGWPKVYWQYASMSIHVKEKATEPCLKHHGAPMLYGL